MGAGASNDLKDLRRGCTDREYLRARLMRSSCDAAGHAPSGVQKTAPVYTCPAADAAPEYANSAQDRSSGTSTILQIPCPQVLPPLMTQL